MLTVVLLGLEKTAFPVKRGLFFRAYKRPKTLTDAETAENACGDA